jgi:hypothetical protein
MVKLDRSATLLSNQIKGTPITHINSVFHLLEKDTDPFYFVLINLSPLLFLMLFLINLFSLLLIGRCEILLAHLPTINNTLPEFPVASSPPRPHQINLVIRHERRQFRAQAFPCRALAQTFQRGIDQCEFTRGKQLLRFHRLAGLHELQ